MPNVTDSILDFLCYPKYRISWTYLTSPLCHLLPAARAALLLPVDGG